MDRKTYTIEGDGKTVWVNDVRCLARFGEFGWEVTSIRGGGSLTDSYHRGGGNPKPLTVVQWAEWVAEVKKIHGVEIGNEHMPDRLRSFPGLLDAALGALVRRVKPAGASDHADAQNAFDDIRSTLAANPGSSVANLKDVLEKLIGPIDESGTRIAGNELTFISAAPSEDGFYVTLTVRY